jgi:hypothetical protein
MSEPRRSLGGAVKEEAWSMRVSGVARLAQIVTVSAAAFAMMGCAYYHDDDYDYHGGRYHSGYSGYSGYYDGYRGDNYKGDSYDRGYYGKSYKGHKHKHYDSYRSYDHHDRGSYGGYGGHYGGYRVCDSDGDRCYGSSEPYWNYREYYRRHGYRWQND